MKATMRLSVLCLLLLPLRTSSGYLDSDPTGVDYEKSDEDDEADINMKSGYDNFSYTGSSQTIATRQRKVKGEDGWHGRDNCYEEMTHYIPFIYRTEKDDQHTGIIKTRKPLEFVVIRDGGNQCFSSEDCVREIASLKMKDTACGGNLLENFIVGGDGYVYEGRGWDYTPYWYLNGLRNNSITVIFLGSYHDRLPTKEAKDAFEAAIVMGVWSGNLSPDYKIISMRDLLQENKYLGERLNHNLISWRGWVKDSVAKAAWEYQHPYHLKLVHRRQWNAQPTELPDLSHYNYFSVILTNGGFRCYSREKCISQIKSEQDSKMQQYGDLLENFYIGEDGSVYEGRGWGFRSAWIQGSGGFITVCFLGSFQSELPSVAALNAFKSFVNTGINLGMLRSDFDLLSLGTLYNDSTLLGDALTRYVEKWSPWKYPGSIPLDIALKRNLLPFIGPINWSDDYDYVRSKSETITPERSHLRFVIIRDGSEFCFNPTQCRRLMNLERRTLTVKYGDLQENFYIGSDGNIYIGRGWNSPPHLHLKYFNNSLITVKFFGDFNQTKPHKMALLAFNALIKHGINLGNLSSDCQIFSFRNVFNDSSLLGDALYEYAQGHERWSTAMTLMDDTERASLGLLPIVFREDWNAKTPHPSSDQINHLVYYLIVGETGNVCFSRERCVSEMNRVQNDTKPLYGDVPDNFYIGMDGNAYEGRGWRKDPYSYSQRFDNNAISVVFLGNFENDLPSPMAMTVFHRLMNYGINTGKIAHNYTIISVRQIHNYSGFLGEKLHNNIKTWDRWIGDVNTHPILQRSAFGPLTIVPRLGYEDVDRYAPKTTYDIPREYVVVFEGGKRCHSRNQCNSVILSEIWIPKFYGYADNFFIGEDGFVYEGLGWDFHSILNVSCSNCTFFTVGFLGSFKENSPAKNATEAFNSLIKWGMALKKISPTFKLVSYREVCENTTAIGEALHQEISTWNHWSHDSDLKAGCNPEHKLLSYSQYAYWKPRGAKRHHLPVEHILVKDRGQRCYSVAECTALMRKEHDDLEDKYGGVTENFYIGDDGNVYEGLGWGRRPYSEEYRVWDKSISVHFYGDFELEQPSQQAVLAFNDIVVQQGILLGLLSPEYTLQFFPDDPFAKSTGTALKHFVVLLNSRRIMR